LKYSRSTSKALANLSKSTRGREEYTSKHVGVLPGNYAMLAISDTGQIPLGRMSELMMVHPTSITNNIDRLEAQGYVRRIPHESDRRTTLAEITSSGREIVDIASHELQKIDFGLDALSSEERVQLRRILRKVRTDGAEVGIE